VRFVSPNNIGTGQENAHLREIFMVVVPPYETDGYKQPQNRRDRELFLTVMVNFSLASLSLTAATK
jgi:hypothetical protein